MPRVFDYTQKNLNIPMQYDNTISTFKPIINGTWVDFGIITSSEKNNSFCYIQNTNGQALTSNSVMKNQISCKPHVYNAGNYYNFPAASASMSEPTTRSICPKGWYLPDKIKETDYSIFLLAYGIDYDYIAKSNYDTGLLALPLSFLRAGTYLSDGKLNSRGTLGYYRMSSRIMDFNVGELALNGSTNASLGFSVRCLSR